MTLRELIDKVRDTRDYENLKSRLGNDLGSLLYSIVNEADKADKELDIVHDCLGDIMNDGDTSRYSLNRIRETLDKIEKLEKQWQNTR